MSFGIRRGPLLCGHTRVGFCFNGTVQREGVAISAVRNIDANQVDIPPGLTVSRQLEAAKKQRVEFLAFSVDCGSTGKGQLHERPPGGLTDITRLRGYSLSDAPIS